MLKFERLGSVGLKVLVVTNLYPTELNPTRGIFVTKRLESFSKFGLVYSVLSLSFRDALILGVLKKILRKETSSPLRELNGVQYEPIFIRRNLIDAIMLRFFSDVGIIDKCIDAYCNAITSVINVSSFDIIYAHGMYRIPAGEVACVLSERFKKPFIIALHGSDINICMPKRKLKYVEILEKASKTVFVSKALLETAKSFGYSGSNAFVIPNGYDPKVFRPLDKDDVRKKLGIYKKEYKYVGFVGNLTPIKRADKLPTIFHNIYKKVSNTFFIVVGNGYLRKKIERETRNLEILFTGRISQQKVAEYMNAMDVMILPSRQEGFGSVALEAQACGTCVVGSDNGGIPEAIGFGDYIVSEGGDFEARLADKVVQILMSGYDRNELILRARNFTWGRIVTKEIDILMNVAKRKVYKC